MRPKNAIFFGRIEVCATVGISGASFEQMGYAHGINPVLIWGTMPANIGKCVILKARFVNFFPFL